MPYIYQAAFLCDGCGNLVKLNLIDECDSWDVWTNEDTIVKGRDDWHWEDDYED